MIAFLQFLLAWMLAFTASAASRAPLDAGGSLIVFALFGGGVALAGRALEDVIRRSEDDAANLAWVSLAANAARIAALAASWHLVANLGLAKLPEALGVAGWYVVPHVLRLAPFLVLAGTARVCLHGAAAAAGAAPASLRASLWLDARMALLPLAPVLLFAAVSDLPLLPIQDSRWARMWSDLADLEALRVVFMLAAATVGLALLPTVLRRVWRCRPLPPGPLRDRLEGYAARVGLRVRDLLVWPTGGAQMNAAVMGIVPRFRYVFFTDALLESLAPDEIEAVFAHEAGHARRGHLLLFLGYTAVLALAAFLPRSVLGPIDDLLAPVPPVLRLVGILLVWLGFVFGWVSRRFEQEADVHGIETVPSPLRDDGTPAPPEAHPFARALERIAAEAGGIREVTGWRHFSVADRVAFVRAYLTDAQVRRTYRRQILLIRGGLLVALAVTGAFTLMRIPVDLREAPARRMLADLAATGIPGEPAVRAARFARAAERARTAGRPADALRWYAEAVRLGAAPDVLGDYAELLEASGRPLGARAAWEDLAVRADAPATLRAKARERASGGPAPPR